MQPISRIDFVRKSTVLAGGAFVAPAYLKGMISDSPGNRVNVAVIGIAGERPSVRGIIDGRGITHVNQYAAIPNVRVKTICDVDERLACTHDHSCLPGRQGCLCGETGLPYDPGRKENGGGCEKIQPHRTGGDLFTTHLFYLQGIKANFPAIE